MDVNLRPDGGRFESNPVEHRADKYREVGFSPEIDQSLLARLSGANPEGAAFV
jgi:hypothetical protein